MKWEKKHTIKDEGDARDCDGDGTEQTANLIKGQSDIRRVLNL
jgi:hypothetical protein